jgi:hypothetical protein
MLKHTLVYYFLILLPFTALCYWAKAADSSTFVTALFVYVFIYRFFVDRLRLLHKGVLTRAAFWKLYFPGLQATYFKELYWP